MPHRTTVKAPRPPAVNTKLISYPIKAEIVKDFEETAQTLRLPEGILLEAVLKAFIRMVDEEHTIRFPLMLTTVEE